MLDWLYAVLLGLVEGLTEFIPVSSTGHLILTAEILGLHGQTWAAFIVLIQLGAILAVVALYFTRLWAVFIRLPTDPGARRFAASVLIAFIPAVIAGVLLHDFIKRVLFESPTVVCVSLIVGGVVLLIVDRWRPRERHEDALRMPLLTSLGIGLFQCLSLIPGVSRSGATIVGGLLLGASPRASAEFSFFLAMPTMAGAFAYDLYKSRDMIHAHDAGLIAVGFLVSFVSGLLVVRWMLGFVSKRGYAPFAWWRIAVGSAGLALIWFGGR